MTGLALVSCALATAPAAAGGLDVVRCELEVLVRERDLAVSATLRATGEPPATWKLELAPEMVVSSVSSGGADVPFTASGRELALDLSGLNARGELEVTVHCAGAPSERFSESRGGHVRSVVAPEMTYVRSQVPWYPSADGDRALHRITVDAAAGLQVRTAGDFSPPVAGDRRAVWTFETAAPIDRAGLAVGPWKVVSSGTYDALVLPEHEANAAGLSELAREALEFHGKLLGPVSRSRFALVEMPAAFGAASGYSEHGYFLLGPQAFADGAGAEWVRGFLAHEAAHQWWGMDAAFSDFASEALAEHAKLRFLAAEQGDAAARAMRRDAIENVVASAAAGKEIALGDIRGWGGDLDGELYRVHAYDKGMMLLAMVERAIGEEAFARALRGLFEASRERRTGWKDLRQALAAAGPRAREVVEQWELPGIPSLRAEREVEKSGSSFRLTGKLHQSGTPKPFKISVPLVAVCGDERVEIEVKLSGESASFKAKLPAEPQAVLIDPDWRLLVARELDAAADPKQLFEAGMQVANSPGEARAEVLGKAIADLRAALASGTLTSGEQGASHTGLGRCLFRLGEHEEARVELEAALPLGAGGPFHRGWVHLRLGCLADLRGEREAALAHYAKVIESSGSSQSAIDKAKAFTGRPYRGYAKDG
jgi:tetratricopeptide (TPR) repeat protein